MRIKRRGINSFLSLVLFMVVLLTSLPAKKEEIAFDHLSLDEGLSQVSVSCILQDSKGFMWFGTQDGLNKYNGYTFKIYRPEDDNPKSISHIRIRTLYEDKSGMLWIGTTGGGLNKFDRKTGTFTRYVHNDDDPRSLGSNIVTAVYQDRAGVLWVGTMIGGLNKFNPETGTFTRFLSIPDDPGSLRTNSVTALFEDKAGVLWIGTTNAWVHRWDREKKRFTAYRLQPEIQEGDGTLPVRALLEDSTGRFWVGLNGGGLHILDRTFGTVTKSYYRTPANSRDSKSLSDNFITALCETRQGVPWIGTRSGGLNKFNRDSETFDTFRNVLDDPKSLSSNHVFSIYEDRSGLLWVGTFSGGVNLYKGQQEKFAVYRKKNLDKNNLNHNMVRSFVEDRQGFLWVGTLGGGLNRFDPQRETVTHYINEPGSRGNIGSNFIFALFTDEAGNLWVGTDGSGLNKYNKKTGMFTGFRRRQGDPRSLSHDSVYAITGARNGDILVGTWGGGVNVFNPNSGTFTRYVDERDDPHREANLWIYTIHEDRDGTLWLGTVRGLTHLNRKTGRFTCYCKDPHSPYSLKHHMVTSIYEDNAGMFWIGTIGGGLNQFNPHKKTFSIYKEKDGLPNNVIYGVLGDEDGNIWLSSNKGLTKFNPNTGSFRNYDVYDGLQSNEFNGGAYYKSRKGEMFFGGVKGFNAFYPKEVKDNPYIPRIVITDFKIFNKSVPIGRKGESPLQESISETEKIELSSNQNFFSFEFAALSYRDSHKNRYAYKMEGFDEDWVRAGTRRYASYTNLSQGEYTFRVKGSNNDMVWNDKGTSVKVIIHPTFWQSNWAYLVYFLVLMGILYGIRWFELTRERGRVRLRESELRAQAAEAQARAIQAEISRKTHELEEARKLQLSMLPTDLPHMPGLDIAVYMETATEVGGDYYDFHLDDDGTLAIAVGDATGHGLKAGNMVSVMKALFCAENSHRDIPGFFHKCTHTLKHMSMGNLYMAMTLLNIKNNELNVASAGMPPLLIYRAKTKTVETVTLKGTPLGAFSHATYKAMAISLEQDDTILLLSDGLPELFNKNGDMFGYQQVAQLFENINHHYKTSDEIITQLKKAGEDWLDGKTPDDDITFVVIKVKGIME